MKKLKKILQKHSGRAGGTVVVRHQGGREKRFLREIDFKRDKKEIWARVKKVEYDPNRNADCALVLYEDGEWRYILAPVGLKADDKIISSDVAPIEPGNALSLRAIPVGTQVHNIEITKGKGGQIAKGAGTAAVIFGKEDSLDNGGSGWILIKLPSGEIRRFNSENMATVGQVGREDAKNEIIGKAGRKRHMGVRPSVRGTAMHPDSHPHGGGEGRSGIGMKYPKTVYGKKAVGKTRSKKRYSNRLIVQRKGGRVLS
jgi:large subunit ribosomal protein L2